MIRNNFIEDVISNMCSNKELSNQTHELTEYYISLQTK